jgi:bis(5'-nucleosyl)-tetraphosphatase (symmetrical)
MATYVIGDLQGCYAEFMALLERIHFDHQHDALWLVGDLVNRGPQSLDILRFLKNFSGTLHCVLGNHDLHLLACAENVRPIKSSDTFSEILCADDRNELLLWLRNQPFIYYDAQLHTVMSHAGVYPFWSLAENLLYADELHQLLLSDQYSSFIQHMYGNDPRHWSDTLTSWPRYRFIMNVLTRMRTIYADHSLNFDFTGSLAEVPASCTPWFKLLSPEYQSLRIVFGHWSALLGETQTKNVEALDTGCVWGNQLTALCLETGIRFSVPRCSLIA